MKKIISCILFGALLVSLAFSLLACDGVGEYSEYGINFRLPKDFKKVNVQSLDIRYSASDATFDVQYIPKSQFESSNSEDGGLGMDFNMTVKEYTEFLIEWNGWSREDEDSQYEYDEKRNATTFYFCWTPDAEKLPNSYYYVTVMKSETAFYVAMFYCLEENSAIYEEKFKDWSAYLSLVE
ncbi:MAG: hypothetical protein IJW38_02680 [Clostridia bacterium]|nr:hypothetical protein [Clostridia bacterium]